MKRGRSAHEPAVSSLSRSDIWKGDTSGSLPAPCHETLLPLVAVFRSVAYVLPVTRLHLKQPCDSASFGRFMALAILVARVQGREALHFVRVCVRDNLCFPLIIRICDSDEFVAQEDTLGAVCGWNLGEERCWVGTA